MFCRAVACEESCRREGFGHVLIGAMACGAPVIEADCPFGPKVILKGGEAGLLVPPEDSAALAAAVERLLQDGELAARLRAEGSQRAQEFAVQRTVPRFEALFEELARR